MIFGLRVILCGAGGLEEHGSLGHQHHAETKNHTSLEVKCQSKATLALSRENETKNCENLI